MSNEKMAAKNLIRADGRRRLFLCSGVDIAVFDIDMHVHYR